LTSVSAGNIPPVIQRSHELVRSCAAGRFPVPELKVCREGSGDERYIASRLAPICQDPQSAIFAQLPHLARSMDDDPAYTTAMLTHIARRLPPSDDPSFIKWLDSLNINVRPALDIALPPTPAPSRGGSLSGSLHVSSASQDLTTKLAAARLAAQEEASRAAAAARRPIHLTAPVDRALFTKASRRGAARMPPSTPTTPVPPATSLRSISGVPHGERPPGLPERLSNPGSVASSSQVNAAPAPEQQVYSQPPQPAVMAPRSDNQAAPTQLPVGLPTSPLGRAHLPAPPVAERQELWPRPGLAPPPIGQPPTFAPALRPYSLATGMRQARPYGIMPPGPPPAGVQGSARPPGGTAPRPPLMFAPPPPGQHARAPVAGGGSRVSTAQAHDARSRDSGGT
jgi:hypothetical protein